MGVSGCGKSTVGLALAKRMGWRFVDADDFHPSANVEKMRAGIPLTDDDRTPWLGKLNAVLRHSAAKRESIVLACSALREKYRSLLADRLPGLRVVHLSGSFELIEARLKARQHRYMPPALLQSQFSTLEPPTHALTLDIARPVAEIVEAAASQLSAPHR
jgi:gluconokinase